MKRMTMDQALVEALIAEGVEVVFGIFGHGNVQLGQALSERRDKIRFVLVKNEQGAVHAATAYARMTGKVAAATSSVGPGATNMVTGAACARINRLPVLILPGEIFAENVGPVLQQLESDKGETVNDAFRPIAKYWRRVNRPQELRRAMRECFDAMLEPGNEGPGVLCMPMDTQTEACDFDDDWYFTSRDRRYPRVAADPEAVQEAARLLAHAKRPLIIAGGGVIRSQAQGEMLKLAEAMAIPVAQTQAGKGCMVWSHPLNVYACGPMGASCGNAAAAEADVVVGIGTRYSDFTTSSETAFHPKARFINLNICHFDVGKQRALKLFGDAKATLTALNAALAPMLADKAVAALMQDRKQGEGAKNHAASREAWNASVSSWLTKQGTPMRQSLVLGTLQKFMKDKSVVINAAGTLPSCLQKLWRDKTDDGKGYLCEYGYSTMGFEIPAGIGCKLAEPDREVMVLLGDMTFLMAPQDLVTAVEQGLQITFVLFDNHGGQSIRNLQRRSGFDDYKMEFRLNGGTGEFTPIDHAKIAEGMGCKALKAHDEASLLKALEEGRNTRGRPTFIHVEVDREDRMTEGGGWWDVPIPEVDAKGQVTSARKAYLEAKKKQTLR